MYMYVYNYSTIHEYGVLWVSVHKYMIAAHHAALPEAVWLEPAVVRVVDVALSASADSAARDVIPTVHCYLLQHDNSGDACEHHSYIISNL